MNSIKKTVLTSFFIFSHTTNANDAALAITTEPREADIFIDGVLKANTTPQVLTIPEGTHQLQIKKLGYETQEIEVLLAGDAVLSKKVQLTPLVSTNAEWLTPDELLNPKRSQFETEAEFAARQKLPLSETIKRFNAAANQHSPLYQAGTAQLENAGYALDTQKFKLKITPQARVKKLDFSSKGFIVIPKDQARALWQEGMEKPVFVTLQAASAKPEVEQLFLVGIEKHWPIQQEQLMSGRYRDNGNGTVTDIQTSLMWKRCSEGQEWNDTTCTGEANRMTWNDAMPNEQQKTWDSFAGHSDWRVPTKDELPSLVYCSTGQPALRNNSVNACEGEYQKPTIDQQAFPNTPESWFWTATPAVSSFSWFVGFNYGIVFYFPRSNGHAVRLVRGGQ